MSYLNPQTYLELVQRTHLECSIQGAVPDSLANAAGTNLQLFLWVNQAWLWVQQLRPNWHFMHRRNLSFATIAGQIEYTPTQAGVTEGEVSSWCTNRFRQYNTAAGQGSEIEMSFLPYPEFYDMQMISSLRTAERVPVRISVASNLSLMVECPLAGYTITGEYYAMASGFEEDDDEPTLEIADRMAIVYKAMEYYAKEQNAPEVLATAQPEMKRIMNRLDIRRLDAMG